MDYTVSFIFMLVIHNVYSSKDTCSTRFTDTKNNEIDVHKYCEGKACVVKCCGENEMIHATKSERVCKDVNVMKDLMNIRGADNSDVFTYNDMKIYKNDIYKGKEVSTKKFDELTFINNERFRNKDCFNALKIKGLILEKGSLVYENPNHYDYWYPIKMDHYCVEKTVGFSKNKTKFMYSYRYKTEDADSMQHKLLFIATSMVISAFFLLVVLVVYSVLPPLQNIQGMLLTAYVATLMCTYSLKACYIFYDVFHGSENCTVITIIIYYGLLASFFWLKLMSFDIWWTFRGSRKRRLIHRRGITVKFLIYASYAYGVPALITIFSVVMDSKDFPIHISKPFFNTCFKTDTVLYYLYVPLMILTGCNIALFLMTMYNIWLIKRNMASFDKNTVNKNRKNQSAFLLYIKLCSLMGVSWILEFVQIGINDDDMPVWLFIALNSYNMLIGPVIFFMFVCKKKTFLMLCKRFRIENTWTRQMYKVSTTSRSTQSKEHSKESKIYSRTRSTIDSDGDGDEARRPLTTDV